MENKQISRRDFIRAVASIVSDLIGLFVGIPSVAYLLSPALQAEEDESLIPLGPIEDFPVGVPTHFEFTRTRVNGWERTAVNYGLYVLRKNKKEVGVCSDVCTHLGCRVSWQPELNHYVSPCHNGHFDIDGNVVSGPPPRPLDEFVTKIEEGNLFVTLPPIKRARQKG